MNTEIVLDKRELRGRGTSLGNWKKEGELEKRGGIRRKEGGLALYCLQQTHHLFTFCHYIRGIFTIAHL